MKIGFIATHIDIGKGGVSTYSYELIKNLSKIDKNNDYYLIHTSPKDIDVYSANHNFLVRSVLPNYLWRITIGPLKLKNIKNLDIVHDPYDIGPLSFKMPFKKIITVHDIAYYFFPRKSGLKIIIGHKVLFNKTLKTADKIIAISNSTKDDLMTYFKVPEDKIAVISHGVGEKFKQLDEEGISKSTQKYQLNFPYILYVGSLESRKNILNLVKAFYKLKTKNIYQKLVIVGENSGNKKKICRFIKKLNLQNDVVFIGFVSEEDLPALYNAADLFVYPSYYEGFGLPPLEAMSCGTPVITSNTSSLPEVVGDAGIMIDPSNVEALAEAMRDVLADESLRNSIIAKGLERAKMFNWKKCARKTLKVYEEVSFGERKC